MPCDMVRTVTCEMQNADLSVLTKALEALGYSVRAASGARTGTGIQFSRNGEPVGSYSKSTGKLSIRGTAGLTADRVKKEYASQAVKVAARKYGWRVESAVGANSHKKLILNKSRY